MSVNLNARITRTMVALTLIAGLIVYLGLMAYLLFIQVFRRPMAPSEGKAVQPEGLI
ncbi:hypothetical protein [Cereibacter changlensis]|uniref:hypothetical protein n=1 Tax=Cereibacter changlensis TaxID=402884 RepID=UPI00145C59C7|nr:hypothetical protein [Cereibacter changlensis]